MSEITLTPELRPLGKSGVQVSPIAWGMWRFATATVAEARTRIEAAFAAGVTLFDTADIYGFDGVGGFGDAETLLGKVFAEAPGLAAQMVLATKGGIRPPVPYDQSANYLGQALDASLARLGVDQVDLYQIHRPDILAHPQEVALASLQPELSPLELGPIETGLLDLAMERDIAVLAWSPLGGGRIGAPEDDRSKAVAVALDVVAQQAGVSRAAAAYAWIMAHPARPIPIVGTQNLDRIAEIGEVYKVRFTRQSWYDVLVASRGERLP